MGKAERFLLVVDFGTGAGRCILVDVDADESHSAFREWAFEADPDGQPGGFRFDPNRFWCTLADLIQLAMKKAGILPAQIAAVSSTSMRQGFVLLDGSGCEIFAVPNMDGRALSEAAEVSGQLGQVMNDVSGHWPSPFMAPARLLWLRRNQPEVLEHAKTLLMINDWILYRLCGEKACEPTNAPETGLFDIGSLSGTASLIRAMDLPLDLFPPVAFAGQVLGSVTKVAADATGLLPGTPVVVAGADTHCGVLGTGALEPGQVGVVAGTGTAIQMILSQSVIDALGRTWSSPFVLPHQWVLESNAGMSGIVFRWFRDSFCQEEVSEAKAAGANAYSLMDQAAATSPIGSAGVTALLGSCVMNAKAVVGFPIEVSTVSGFVLSDGGPLVTDPRSKRHFIHAMLESFAFAVRANLDQLERISGCSIASVGVGGGLSTSDLWMQMLADVLGESVKRPVIAETTSVGAAACAGVGAKHYSEVSAGIARLVKGGSEFVPHRKLREFYDAAYQRWLAYQVYEQ